MHNLRAVNWQEAEDWLYSQNWEGIDDRTIGILMEKARAMRDQPCPDCPLPTPTEALDSMPRKVF